MSKLDDLIQNYCTNGVAYKKLGEVCNFINGFAFKSSLFKNTGLPIIRITNINGTSINMEDLKFFDGKDYNINLQSFQIQKGDILIAMSGATTGKIGYYNNDDIAYINQRVGKFVPNTCFLNNRYLFHFLRLKTNEIYTMAGGGAQPNLSSYKLLNNFSIPIPPLPVQEEIVRILDSFTELTNELINELTNELTARKKQYEYYRDKLLMPKENVPTVELGEVCTFVRGPFGGALKKEIFKKSGFAVYEQQHAIYRNLNFRYYIDSDKFNELKRFGVNKGDMIISCSGTIGKTFVIPDNAPKGIINQALLKLTPNQDLDVFYLQYFFENTISKIFNSSARGGAIKNVPSVNELKKIKIPLPSLETQKRIVDVLDNFEKICSDLNIGLPAEIAARQKQYEYYRDKLLTFKEAK